MYNTYMPQHLGQLVKRSDLLIGKVQSCKHNNLKQGNAFKQVKASHFCAVISGVLNNPIAGFVSCHWKTQPEGRI